jgi:hypothetical protein
MDCEGLPGKLRNICDGTARKKSGEPFSDEERQAILQKRMGLESPDDRAETAAPVVKKRGCGCGKKK